MTLIRHPGPERYPRVLVEASAPAAEFRLGLAAGQDLLTGLESALGARGVAGATVALAGGTLAPFSFVTGVPDPTGFRIATHSEPVRLAGPVLLIAGTAIFGHDQEGARKTHCHAVLCDAEGGVRGGHVVAGGCMIGGDGLAAWVTTTGAAAFEVAFDGETNFPIFHPARAPRGGAAP